MSNAPPVLELQDVHIAFQTRDGRVPAVSGVSMSVSAGECVGIVGESGAGKSQLMLAVMGLAADNAVISGHARFEEIDLLHASRSTLDRVRGSRIAMIFQDPMTSLTPHLRIGDQIAEVLVGHKGMSWRAARMRAVELLDRVRVADPRRRLDQYPHELSGGMRQRVMIAIALACDPKLLIADEPTTALDVTVQAQILALLAEIKRESGMSIVIITHDLGVVAGIADRVAVMYAGRIVEMGEVGVLLKAPSHPYTEALLRSMPRIDDERQGPLASIPGQPPDPRHLPIGCAFGPRCAYRAPQCESAMPLLVPHERGAVACHFPLRPSLMVRENAG